jgi:hypothetical protein
MNLNVGMILRGGSKLSGGSLLLAMFVKIGMPQDGHSLAFVAQSESSLSWKLNHKTILLSWLKNEKLSLL